MSKNSAEQPFLMPVKPLAAPMHPLAEVRSDVTVIFQASSATQPQFLDYLAAFANTVMTGSLASLVTTSSNNFLPLASFATCEIS